MLSAQHKVACLFSRVTFRDFRLSLPRFRRSIINYKSAHGNINRMEWIGHQQKKRWRGGGINERKTFLSVVLLSLRTRSGLLCSSSGRSHAMLPHPQAKKTTLLLRGPTTLAKGSADKNRHLNCKGPQTNMPQKVRSIKDLTSKNKHWVDALNFAKLIVLREN